MIPSQQVMTTPASIEDRNYQERILQDVSRTFALTIPQLPPSLYPVIGNAYLLCRIVDTVEDDNGLSSAQTRKFVEMFIQVVSGEVAAEAFAEELYPLLSAHTIPAEQDLIKNTPAVIRITHSFNPAQRRALERCVRIMGQGMADYQDSESLAGLKDLAALDRYCYYVAGVVGEMLTELFSDYSAEINRHKPALMELSISFGQGLQMTNILKDIWEDRKRGACWLPQDIFREQGFDLNDLRPGCNDPRFNEGLGVLIGIAKAHLRNALTYTCMIPPKETGIRRFCLWALGMAVLTLNKINQNRAFVEGNQVKISRQSVKATVLLTSTLARQDWALEKIFAWTSHQLPEVDILGKKV